MFAAALAVSLLTHLLQATPAKHSTATVAELRARLDAYERGAAAGRADASELAAIAKAVLQRTAASTSPDALVQTCSSKYVADDTCSSRLWALAKRPAAALEYRASAAAALARRGDKEAAAYLFTLVKDRPPQELARAGLALLALPAERSVPLLEAMLQSPDPTAQGTACRVLAQIDAGESRQALSTYLASAPRGTGPWFACTLASATLGDPGNQQMAGYLMNHLSGDDLVIGADLLMNTDRERAISHLLQVTREGRGVTRLDAAERLATMHPEVTDQILQQGLSDDQAETRAAALELYRILGREPSPEVRGFLLDPSPIVQVRAAEAVLAADARRRAAGGGEVLR